MKLTDQTVKTAACPAGKRDVLLFDEALKGFGLRVTNSGARVFIFQYRNGKTVRREALGAFGTELTTAQARRKAEALRGQVRDRQDPVAERKARLAATLVEEAKARAVAARNMYTVNVLISDWTEHHLVQRSAAYRKRVPIELRRAMAEWLDVSADSIARSDVVRVLDAIKVTSGPVAANRLRAEARACWNWATKRGTLDANPWEATPRPLAREVARERVLSDMELGLIYSSASKLSQPWDVMIKILILTGQRRGEVSGMRWDELDLDANIWTLPSERTKNRQSHVVPLTMEAVTLLRTVKRRQGAKFVFEGPRKTAMTGFGKTKARLDAELDESMQKCGRKHLPWVIHDFRRTLATGLQKLGIRLEVTEAILNHVSGSRSGIVGVYQRHGWECEKKAALDAWNSHISNISKCI